MAGAYLITINAVREFPTSARPRFGMAGIPTAPLTAMSPDDPAKPTRWTAQVNVTAQEVSNAGSEYAFFPSSPSAPGGFIQAYVGKVTIRKL
jgi:hypothetical protein